ncbi:MAG: hypothetical protein IJ783_04225 [Kiritimatiellae bacterium]|nr:hypothetical protein [Kiritimatiellia bacterium]
MKKIGLYALAGTFLGAQLFLSGCVAAFETARFSVAPGDVPSVANTGDKYFVVRIDEQRIASADMGQSPPGVETVRKTLEERHGDWFSSGPDAIPVMVKYRTSISKGMNAFENISLVLWYPVHFCSLGLVPIVFPASKMDFETSLKTGPETATHPFAYRGTSKLAGGNKLTATEALFPESRGWHRYAPKERGVVIARTRFDIDERAKLDAFCASVALAVQRLTPEERKALRENNEAWWLDAKLGNKRNRPIAVVKESAPDTPVAPDRRSGRPRIISQEWDSASRSGKVCFAVDSDTEMKTATAWLTDEYLPEYCRTLGIVVSADDPASAPPPAIRVGKPAKMPDATYVIRFSVGE